jgi:hypothetical protein
MYDTFDTGSAVEGGAAKGIGVAAAEAITWVVGSGDTLRDRDRLAVARGEKDPVIDAVRVAELVADRVSVMLLDAVPVPRCGWPIDSATPISNPTWMASLTGTG